jgi:DUF438 domain-containing protein
MLSIQEFMANDHRHCDDYLTQAEQAVARQAWDSASLAMAQFQKSVLQHFEAEEGLLFPAFEAKTGMTRGPTQVMRGEHAQIRELVEAARGALAAHDADDFSGNFETLLIMLQQHNVKEENVLYPMCDVQLQEQRAVLLPQLQASIGGHAA